MSLREFGTSEVANVQEVLASGQLSCLTGDMTKRFEKAFAEMVGAEYAEAMCTGMCLMHSALMAFDVQAGDEVLCDPMVAFGSLAVRYCNAVPVFVDVKPGTMNMDPDKIEAQITERTKALIVTHMWGLPAEIDRIVEIARKHGIRVLEDCAHAILASYKGKQVGTWGDVGFFSFQMSKQMGLGDGAMGTTNDPEMKEKLGLMGGAPTFGSVAEGIHYNYRINELVSAVGLAQLGKVKGYIEQLQKNARILDEAVASFPFIVPQRDEDAEHTYHYWTSTYEGDDVGDLKRVMTEEGVPAMIGYTNMAAYQQPFIKNREGHGLDCADYRGDKNRYPDGLCPNAEYIMPRLFGISPFVQEDVMQERADKVHRALTKL